MSNITPILVHIINLLQVALFLWFAVLLVLGSWKLFRFLVKWNPQFRGGDYGICSDTGVDPGHSDALASICSALCQCEDLQVATDVESVDRPIH